MISYKAFSECWLTEVVIPASVKLIGRASEPRAKTNRDHSFCGCCPASLRVVTFATPSRLRRIGVAAFQGTAITAVVIPASVEVLDDSCFCECEVLERLTFEPRSRLERIEVAAFMQSGLSQLVVIPVSVEVLGPRCFACCQQLTSVMFAVDSQLREFDSSVFAKS
jgi:hypothetical protein